MIKNRIENTKNKLKRLQQSYDDLVEKIKETFYEKKEYWVKNSPRKPNNDTAKMSAAYCLLTEKCPGFYSDLKIQLSKNWDTKESLGYWLLYDDFFSSGSGTTPVKLIFKKDLKKLEEICKSMWIISVSKSYNGTTLGFNDWKKSVNSDDLFKLMQEHMNGRVYIINDRKLFLKDIVIVLPYENKNFINFE